MRYYLSGMMRPLPEYNFPMFRKVSAQLRSEGLDIVSPHEFGDSENDTRGQLMTEDLLLILNQCDGIICLPGWQNSPGASAEVAICFGTERPVYEYIPIGEGFRLEESKVVMVTVPRENQYALGIPLIGLCGYAQTGKDTTANFLVKKYDWTRVAFADALRDVLYALNPIVVREVGGVIDGPHNVYRVQDLVDEWGWDKVKVEWQEVRALLQRLGTEAGRDIIDPNLWVGMGEEKIESAGGPVVVTDCRFPNELSLIKRRKGTLIWVERPGTGPANAHASEHTVSKDDCDLVLLNNGTIDDLYLQIDKVVAKGPFGRFERPEPQKVLINGYNGPIKTRRGH